MASVDGCGETFSPLDFKLRALLLDFDRKGQVIAVRWDGGRAAVVRCRDRPPDQGTRFAKRIQRRAKRGPDPDGSRLAAVGSGETIYLYVCPGTMCRQSRWEATGTRSLRFAFAPTATVCSPRRPIAPPACSISPVPVTQSHFSDTPHASRLAAFSPDGRLSATAANDHTVRIWDTGTGQCLMVLRHEHNRDVVGRLQSGRRVSGRGHGRRVCDRGHGMDRRTLSSTGSRITGPGKSLAATATWSAAWLFIRTGGRSFRRRPTSP